MGRPHEQEGFQGVSRLVKALLDTNVFLWSIAGEKSRFSRRAAKGLTNLDTQLVLSVVSLWEIALKVQAGRLEVPLEKAFFQEQIGLLGIHSVLAVEASHVFALFNLPTSSSRSLRPFSRGAKHRRTHSADRVGRRAEAMLPRRNRLVMLYSQLRERVSPLRPPPLLPAHRMRQHSGLLPSAGPA